MGEGEVQGVSQAEWRCGDHDGADGPAGEDICHRVEYENLADLALRRAAVAPDVAEQRFESGRCAGLTGQVSATRTSAAVLRRYKEVEVLVGPRVEHEVLFELVPPAV